MHPKKNVSESPDMSWDGIYKRIKLTGEVEIINAGWGMNHIPGWTQGEWLSPVIMKSLVSQGLMEQVNNKLILTEKGKVGKYDSNHHVNFTRTEVVEIEGETTTTESGEKIKKTRTKIVAAGKLTDESKLKLLKVANAKAGEALFLKIWNESPEQTGTITSLAKAYEMAGAAGQKDALASSKYYVKLILKRGDAEIIL